ncbi:hypothetical protein BDD12DRAFT_743411 [Trichophaea hybrida]|nr:hypothetical protein BDD12DRAFT_743411 [Trichophaea hybrida]
MLRATRRRISLSILLRRPHPPSPALLFLPFLYLPLSRNIQWLQNSLSVSAIKPSPNPLRPRRTYSTTTCHVPLPDTLVGIDGGYNPGSIPVGLNGRDITSVEGPSLLIVDTPRLRDTVKKKARIIGGISEDKHEVLATFEACIRVGRIARAQLMLNTITNLLDITSTLLVGAHNTFLKALLNRALAENSQDSLRVFFTWYEDTMKRELNISGDATTMGLLMEGCFAVAEKRHGTRYIQRYFNYWKEQGRDINEVFALSILSDEHVIAVAKICGLKPDDMSEKYKNLYLEGAVELAITKVAIVQSSDVKGSSLAAIKQSLASLTDPDSMPSRHSFGQDDVTFQIERQKHLEMDAMKSAHERWKKDHEQLVERGIAPLHNSVNTLLWSWHQALVPLIKQELQRVSEAEENPGYPSAPDRCLYGPFLRLMTPEKVAAVVILEIIRMQNLQLNGEGTKSSHAVMAIGKILEQEYYAQELAKRKNRDVFGSLEKEELGELFNNMAMFRAVIKKARQKLLKNPQQTVDLLLEWPGSVKAKLGAVLISMLLHCAKVCITKLLPNGERSTQHHPAIQHAYNYVKGRRLGVLKLHPDVVQKLGSQPLRGSSMGRNLPMLVPPLPWLAWNEGGYYYTRSRVVRTKASKEQDIYVQTASNRGDLDQLFQGLDVLGQTAWKINKRVFDVVLQVWNNGEEFADIPPRDTGLAIPPEPAPNENPRVRMEWVKEVRRIKVLEKNNHSQRCNINLKLEIARAFLFEKFYFPHNVDFRGRAYPIPPNLNHIGDDLSRGLLMFDEGKELGENGLRWLKIHCANLAGYDKASFTDRVKFVEENLEDVIDSAKNPLRGRRWWLKAEDPWQCLAACISITGALKSPDPTKYKCHTIVAQDGTCNGLQHYAALGGDLEGAKQVNLEPSDKPQDVYTGVAELVKAQVKKDADGGHSVAILLLGHITRKVVKQSVMTNVYGVTFIGARAQIQKQLEDNPAIPRQEVVRCAGYLARLVFDGIKSVFTGATKIQHWLALAARMISRSVSPAQYGDLKDHHNGVLEDSKNSHIRRKGKVEFMTSVVWTTPLRMAVVQPYRQESNVIVQTNLQKIYISDPSAIDQVNSKKQMTAFPPNFIHSLDATHMLLSARKCAEIGIAFAAVHDSFWTHPIDVDKLNRILREAFIELHSVNIMEKLKDEFETRYKGYKYLVSIPRHAPQAKLIKAARKQYAMEVLEKSGLTIVEDLEWELKRDRLLASEDPQERHKGEKMITPSAILHRAGGARVVEVKEPLGAELGEVPSSAAVERAMAQQDVFDDDDTAIDKSSIIEAMMEDGEEEHMELENLDEVREVQETENTLPPTRSKETLATGIHVWVPLEFPPLPPKGDFEVERLKNSQYFFS